MKEIELRLALVFYGGVSLAIYMHGVSREILNIVRASSWPPDHGTSTGQVPDTSRSLSPVQAAYQRFLDKLAPTARVRVIADAIAGASAGGVNGIMLARALAHDLPLGSHTSLWLKNADVTRLAEKQNGFSRYLKLSVSPVVDRLVGAQLNKQIQSEETREKLRHFMQARWFSPPFSGERFTGWMLDACRKMDEEASKDRTLIPRGQTLDLFVTLTDYNGIKRRIHLYDPAFIEEWDHRRILNFHASHPVTGQIDSQFDAAAVPDLVFAARATSSFPGAFPPATVKEMDRVLAGRDETWPNRTGFLQRGLSMSGTEERKHCFVDGSVVMNKPFAPVIDVITARPAARQVARRLIYIDPAPNTDTPGETASANVPGFFRVILASLAHIPRNEPIGDDLKEIEANNRRSRWLAQVIDAADPMVEEAVSGLLPARRAMTSGLLAKSRGDATEAAFRQAGFANINYQSLKLHALAERLSGLFARLATQEDGARCEEAVLVGLSERFAALSEAPDWKLGRTGQRTLELLKGLDVDYRIRRLRFVIRKINSFYQPEGGGAAPANPDALDRLKGILYEQIDHLSWRWSDDFYGETSREAAREICRCLSAGTVPEELFGQMNKQFTDVMGLLDLDRLHDEIIAVRARELLEPHHCLSLVRAYVGFAYYDIITFPVLQRNDFAEVTEILVDRISPHDADTLVTDGFELKGRELGNFGAFFNRSWREHDYLWGRLNTADRMVSIVLSAAGRTALTETEIAAARADIFRAVLDEELHELTGIPEEFGRIDKIICERLDVPDQ